MLKGLKFYSPLLAPLLLVSAFSVSVSFLDRPECTFLLGMNVSVLTLLSVCFLLPVTFFIGTLYFLYFSVKAKGQDCYPPVGIPWRGLFIGRTGRKAQVAKAAGYLAPMFSLWLIWLGASSFNQIADGRTFAEMNTVSATACQSVFPAPDELSADDT